MHLIKAIATPARLSALAASAVGVAVFYYLDLPLPFMLGPMFGCLIAAMAGAPLQGLGWLATAMRIVLGVAVGTAITPELLGRSSYSVGPANAEYRHFRRTRLETAGTEHLEAGAASRHN